MGDALYEYKPVLVQSQDQLDALIPKLVNSKELYIDMEADNMYHYKTSISLIQILLKKFCYLIDVMAPLSLNRLIEVMAKKTLVIHGSDYDLRLLYQGFNFEPYKVFDTMIAARLIGMSHFGLAALVEEYFQKTLNKKHQRADWSKRPFKQELIDYAAEDTVYLPHLKKILERELKSLKRISWHEEFCHRIVKGSMITKDIDSEHEWRLKGSANFSSFQLNIVRALWYWRESLAEKYDMPRYRVLNSKVILQIAYSLRASPHILEIIKKISIPTSRRFKASAITAIMDASNSPQSSWPNKEKNIRYKQQQPNPEIIESLRISRDSAAKSLNLPPELLASRDSLINFAKIDLTNSHELPNVDYLMNWQQKVLFPLWSKILLN